MVEVEDAPDDVVAARTWVRRHAPWLVASVALVVGSLATTQLVLDHREDARVAALAAIPGVVPPVDASIGVLWRADAELAPVIRSGAVVDGVLVGGTQDATGAAVIVGLDPGTGEVAWRTPVDAADAAADPDQRVGGALDLLQQRAARQSHVAACTSQQYGEGVSGHPAVGRPGCSTPRTATCWRTVWSRAGGG